MAKRSRRSSHRRTKRRSVRSTRSRRHHRARHTRGRGKRYGGNPPLPEWRQLAHNDIGRPGFFEPVADTHPVVVGRRQLNDFGNSHT